MAVECKEIVDYMNEIAPEYLAESWDNVGLLVGDKNSIIKKVLVALDCIDSVIDEAIQIEANLIITHHPMIFKSIKRVNADTLNGRIYKLIKNNISLYSAHTNLDVAFGGTNDILADKLEILSTKVLDITLEDSKKYGLGRIGTLKKETTFLEYAQKVKQILKLSSMNVVGDMNKKIKTVALCTGSGSEYLVKAYEMGADLYISGDVKFHDAQKAQELGICWIDATHYASENIAMPTLKDYLEKQSKLKNWQIEILVSNIDGQPFKIL